MAENEAIDLPSGRGKRAVPIDCVRNNYFGEALRELRLQMELTQNEAADLVHITQAQWSGYESGKSRPTFDMIITIAQSFGISPFVLVNKSLDKSKYFDPADELSFDEFAEIEENIKEEYRKKKLQKRLAELH